MRMAHRSAISLALLGAGLVGMVVAGVSGAQILPWLAVLGLGVVCHVATEAARQRQRVSRRTARQLQGMQKRLEELSDRLNQVGTPEGMKAFRDTVQQMANDLRPIVEAFKSGALREALRSQLTGKPR